MTPAAYQPPYTLTPAILRLAAEIGEAIGRYTVLAESRLTPRLRRENRIRTIQASLAIENNTLSLAQVTAVIEGRRVLGDPREIQEVRNAFAAYERLTEWRPTAVEDLLAAHGQLMSGLVDEAGRFRSGGVGVFRGKQMVHMAPPAELVPAQAADLLLWLERTQEHPLVASCVVHYELEFIHPFADGNGRMGRLWQTLILRQWRPLLAFLPMETVIRDRQEAYYSALAESDQRADSAPFIEFMLAALLESLLESLRKVAAADHAADQVSDQVSDQVGQVIEALAGQEMGRAALMTVLGFVHRPSFRVHYLDPALSGGWIERTQPEAPRSPSQRYRLTEKGRVWLRRRRENG